jgi:ATP-dependent protease ClpP protease subunit
VEYQYTINPFSEKPVMMIDRHIGYLDGEGYGIMAGQFQREMQMLLDAGAKEIEIRMNSIGGQVFEGMGIFNAIESAKSKCKIKMVNIGLVASIAGVIFQAGDEREMADYALMMVHGVQNAEGELEEKITESLITMLCRSGKRTRNEVAALMQGDNWLTAAECLDAGFCTSITNGDASVRKVMQSTKDIAARYKEIAAITNKLKHQSSYMNKQITNALGLQEGAAEDIIAQAINSLKEKSAKATDSLKAKDAEISTLNTKVGELTNTLNATIQERDTLKAQIDEANAEALATNVAAELTNAINLGKIANSDEARAKWSEKLVADFEGTKELLNSIPASKKAPEAVTSFGVSKEAKTPKNYAGSVMLKIAEKLKNKA